MTVKNTLIITVLFFFVLLLSLQLFVSHPARADHLSAPVHHISMGFDLETNSYSANSRIELPAGVGLQLNLSGLNVSRILVNGQPGETTPESYYLDIQKSSKEQEILITYNSEIQPDYASYNMISKTGIALLDHWHPVADREMIFKLTVEIPDDFEAVSEADEIITFQVDNKKQVTFRFPHPLHSIHFVTGPYRITRREFGEGKELVAYFYSEDSELAGQYIENARQYLDRYEKMLGPYPFKRFSIVENRLPTGFAMPTFTLLGQSVVRLPFIVDTSLGHEVLHSWFGSGVRMSSRKGNWVEGLTTYLADQAFAADKGEEVKYRKEQILKYQSYVRPDMDLTLRHFSNAGHGNSEGRPARAVGYNKSSMFFHMLKNRVGPEIFIDSLRDFYKRLKHDIAD
ncbi:M1 family metallopeptidase, partial [Thermodesulfobacteriota bacterium]